MQFISWLYQKMISADDGWIDGVAIKEANLITVI